VRVTALRMPAHSFSIREGAHAHRIDVTASDIDGLGHANNVVWVRWINEAAIAHAEAVGLGEARCKALGAVWVVRRHDVEYLQPAFEGEQLTAHTWPETLRGPLSLRRTLFTRGEEVLLRAETQWVLVDVRTGKPRRAGPEMLEGYGFKSVSPGPS